MFCSWAKVSWLGPFRWMAPHAAFCSPQVSNTLTLGLQRRFKDSKSHSWALVLISTHAISLPWQLSPLCFCLHIPVSCLLLLSHCFLLVGQRKGYMACHFAFTSGHYGVPMSCPALFRVSFKAGKGRKLKRCTYLHNICDTVLMLFHESPVLLLVLHQGVKGFLQM